MTIRSQYSTLGFIHGLSEMHRNPHPPDSYAHREYERGQAEATQHLQAEQERAAQPPRTAYQRWQDGEESRHVGFDYIEASTPAIADALRFAQCRASKAKQAKEVGLKLQQALEEADQEFALFVFGCVGAYEPPETQSENT